MAKVSTNPITNIDQDWGNDPNTGLPFSGKEVQSFIKGELKRKAETADLDKKVDAIAGKGLSTEDFTTEEKAKLASLTNIDISGKVDKEEGKGLSTNDFTNDFKTKLEGIAEGATRVIVDDTIKESTNPVQNRAVNAAVLNLNTEIGKKADTTALNSAVGRITALENNGATGVTVTESGEGNGIASIKNVGKNIIATKATFVTSLTGYVNEVQPDGTQSGNGIANITKEGKVLKVTKSTFLTEHQSLADYVKTEALTTALTSYAKKTDIPSVPTKLSELVNDSGYITTYTETDPVWTSEKVNYYTKDEINGKNYLTEHQSLAGYATQTWVNEQGFATGTIPTKTSELNNDSGFLTQQSLNGYWNQLYVDERDGNGIAEIWVDIHNKSELCVSKRRFITPETLGTSIDDYASNKGYLTENNLNEKLKETVSIKLVSDKSASDTNLNGAKVTVKSGDTTVSTQTWQGTPINVKVPCDKEVTIEAATVKMYVKPKVLKYVPSPLYNREVTVTYKTLETGVFIIDKNDKTYKTAKEFTDSGTDIKDVIGTLLVTDNVAIVVANYNSGYVLWGPNVLVDGCTVANDTTTAVQDFAGVANTAAIMKVAGSSSKTAAYICYNYIFGNGRRGHLMSAGEGAVIQQMSPNIVNLMKGIGISNDSIIQSSKYYWTSTQNNASSAYRYPIYSNSPQDDFKDNVNYVIPIYSLYD